MPAQAPGATVPYAYRVRASVTWSAVIVVAAAGLVACGGVGGAHADGGPLDATHESETEGASLSDSESDAGTVSIDGGDAQDAPASDVADQGVSDASVMCGDASCARGQFCMYQSPGVAPPCTALNDAGGCATPAMYMPSCPSTGGKPGCFVDVPPLPVGCATVPSACSTSSSCSCLSEDPCMQSCPCGVVGPGAIYCGCP